MQTAGLFAWYLSDTGQVGGFVFQVPLSSPAMPGGVQE